MPFLILLLCPEVHHILLAPIKSQTNLRVFMDFDIGRLVMRHTYERCFGKSLFLMETTIFDLKPDALRTLFCAFLCFSTTNDKPHQIDSFFGGA